MQNVYWYTGKKKKLGLSNFLVFLRGKRMKILAKSWRTFKKEIHTNCWIFLFVVFASFVTQCKPTSYEFWKLFASMCAVLPKNSEPIKHHLWLFMNTWMYFIFMGLGTVWLWNRRLMPGLMQINENSCNYTDCW